MSDRNTQEARFNALRKRAHDARARHARMVAELRAKYAPLSPYSNWEYSVPRGKREALKAAFDRAFDEEHAFIEYVNSISPRNWSTGVPARWIVDELTFEDAMTEGQLSVVPPVPYGGTQEGVRRFAAPVEASRVRLAEFA